MRFTKFAGFDANGDIFGNNDRVGIEPRNTFVGDNFRTVDFRIGRTIPFHEKRSFEVIAEAFNLFNTTNIRFFNTVYGASDFCPADPNGVLAALAQRITRKGRRTHFTGRRARCLIRDKSNWR